MAGNTETYVLGNVGLYGLAPGAQTPDLRSPGFLRDVVINDGNPLNIPMDVSFFGFDARMRIQDDVTGFEFGSFTYTSPGALDSIYVNYGRLDRVSGTLQNGTYQAMSSIGRFAEAGDYTLSYVYANDRAGNQSVFDLENLDSTVPTTITVVNPGADASFPTLSAPVTISDTGPDVTMNLMDVDFEFSLSDVGSGLSYGNLQVFHSTNRQAQWKYDYFSIADRTGGDEFAATFKRTIPFETSDPSGIYWYQLSITDKAGRTSVFGRDLQFYTSPADPLPEGSDETIEVSSDTGASSDTTPPVLDMITILSGFDLADGDGNVDVNLGVSDDMTPLLTGSNFFGGYNYLTITSSTGGTVIQIFFGENDLVSGDLVSGMYNFKVSVSQGIEGGRYTVEVGLTNEANLFSRYSLRDIDMPFPESFPGYHEIENTGIVDMAAPIPMELTVTPVIASTGTNLKLRANLRVWDEGSGFKLGNISLRNGTDQAFGSRNSLWSMDLAPPGEGSAATGDQYDASYEFEVDVSANQFSGDFLSFVLSLEDEFGNKSEYDSSIYNYGYGSFPLPYNRTQVEIVSLADEDDYLVFADKVGTFPAEATEEQKALDYDYDHDGRTNGEEFVEGTSVTDINDLLTTWIEHEDGVGSTIYFHPYMQDRQYTLKQGLSTGGSDPEPISSVPLLGDLPGVGQFFRAELDVETNLNLLVFISVGLVDVGSGE